MRSYRYITLRQLWSNFSYLTGICTLISKPTHAYNSLNKTHSATSLTELKSEKTLDHVQRSLHSSTEITTCNSVNNKLFSCAETSNGEMTNSSAEHQVTPLTHICKQLEKWTSICQKYRKSKKRQWTNENNDNDGTVRSSNNDDDAYTTGKIIHSSTNEQVVAYQSIINAMMSLEQNYVDWYVKELCSTPEPILARRLLATLSGISVFLPRTWKNNKTLVSESTFVNDSSERLSCISESSLPWEILNHSFLSSFMHDALCVCLRKAAVEANTCQECVSLIEYAVQLELQDGMTVQMISQHLLNYSTCMSYSAAELVEVTRLLSLAAKRCEMRPLKLDLLLSRLQSTSFNAHQSLTILSSLLRFKMQNLVNGTVAIVSRKAACNVSTSFQVYDLVFALRVVAICEQCDVGYACAVLERCTVLLPTVEAHVLADIAKCVTMLNRPSRPHPLFVPCQKELRRLLPAIASRAEELFGDFDLRDARLVLRCLTLYHIKHGVVLSKLLTRYDERDTLIK